MSFSRHKTFLLRPALGTLGAILRTALFAVGHADGIKRAADYVVTNSGEIFHAAATNEHNRVLLQVVADAGDVGSDLDPVGQPDTGYLTQRGVRLLGRLGVDAGANAAPLGRPLQCRRGCLVARRSAAFSHELTECRQTLLLKIPQNIPAPHITGIAPATWRSTVHEASGGCFSPVYQPKTRTSTVAA